MSEPDTPDEPAPTADTAAGPSARPATEPTAAAQAGQPPPARPGPQIQPTKEHRLFLEFAEAVRRERYIGLCYGAPGVGKTESARAYAHWDQLGPHLLGTHPATAPVGDVTASRAVLYTAKIHSTPQHLDKDISYLCDRLGWTVELMLQTSRTSGAAPDPTGTTHSPSRYAEVLLVDEAERLKTAALEQLRDHHDRTGIGLILIGMPGIEKRLARYPQLYSRVGFVHHYKPLSTDEQAFVLAQQWPHLRLGDTEDFTSSEAVAAITRITNGNFRLTTRLISQIERVLAVNRLTTVTKEVVEKARENLVIGVM